MAQDTRTITIEILNSNKSSSGSNGGGGIKEKKEETGSLNDIFHPMNALTRKIDRTLFGKTYFFTQAYNNIKNLAISTAENIQSRYYNMSENYMGENTFNNVKNNISKAGSFVSSVAAGASMGGYVGAAIGAITWVGGQHIAYNTKLSSYHSALNAYNMNTAFSNTRASLYDGGRGTEN